MCLAGASELSEPGALLRGGGNRSGNLAGVFAVDGEQVPEVFSGFRCAR
jgi:hypothetical protein